MPFRPPGKPSGGSGLLALLALVLVLAIAYSVGWADSPTDAPNPTSTANPEVLPPSGADTPGTGTPPAPPS
jgi:hypothetical protein